MGRRGMVVSANPLASHVPSRARQAYQALNPEDRNTPLLSNADQQLYPPGSSFKIVTSMAALSTGAITPSTTYADQPRAEKARSERAR